MKYLEVKSTDPYLNLALENYIFEYMEPKEDCFLLWQIDNTILVGKHQNTVEEINCKFVDEHHIHVVRRLTGGGAVFHDLGNINYSFIVKRQRDRDFNFAVFAEPVLRVMNNLGIKAEFSGRNDLLIDGMKFSGNAQCVNEERLLHHGCIMVDADVDYLSSALQVKKKKYESRSIKSVRSRVTSVNSHLSIPLNAAQFKKLLLQEVLKDNENMEPLVITEADWENIKKLKEKRFAAWQWNYGKSPAYNLRREKKFPAGLVTVYMQVDKGRVESLNFYGDFFGNKNISELEKKFVGLPLKREDLLAALEKMQIGSYMNGISAQNIYDLIRYS
ncbi:lipoate--protein ligase [Colibacter massiliensis]|uniref:lipoate--protein ligase n=1 Tax=Colibacter massiliensis TaxID=1852379 RepID=UPI0023553CF5|nr:lipoate--protein ligase [Colibacter massiliensis]